MTALGRRFCLALQRLRLPRRISSRCIQSFPMPSSTSAYDAVLEIPFGAIGLRCSASRLCAIDYLPPQAERPAHHGVAAEACMQLREYLSDPLFRFDLPLAEAGTHFQRRVWRAISAIPAGAPQTYGELAKALKTAPLAVGQACGANPFPVVVPCHRVVGAGGHIGGFAHARDGYLIEIKRWLLEHEARARQAA